MPRLFGNRASVSADNTIQLGNSSVTDVKTNSSCIIGCGALNLSTSATSSDNFNDATSGVTGAVGDIRLATHSTTSVPHLMLCITPGTAGTVLWKEIAFT